MDFIQIRLALHIAEHGSLTQAAVALGVEQSILSRQLTALETEYGERLFHRTGRGMTPTEFGATILPRLRWLLEQTDRIEAEIKHEAKIVSGNVRIGLLPALSGRLASKLFPVVRERYERVCLQFFEGSNGQLEEWLANGTIDLAMLYRYGAARTAAERVLGTNDAHLIGAADAQLLRAESVMFRQLDGLPLVLPNMPNALRTMLDGEARRQGIRLNVIAEADSIGIQKTLAQTSQSYAVLGRLAIEAAEREALRSALIVEPVIRRSAVLAVSARKPLTTAMRALVREIEDLAPPLLAG